MNTLINDFNMSRARNENKYKFILARLGSSKARFQVKCELDLFSLTSGKIIHSSGMVFVLSK